MATIILKASFQTTTRRFPIPEAVTFSTLYELLHKRFACVTPFIVTYNDSDNDVITISSDDELVELITTAKRQHQPIRIRMLTQQEVEAEATARSSTVLPQPILQQAAHLEQILSGLHDLLSTVNQTINAQTAAQRTTNSRGIGRKPLKPGDKERQENQRAQKGFWSRMRAYMSAYPSGKHALRKELASVSPQVKAEFKSLIRYIRKSDDRANIFSAVKEAFPVFRGWVSDELDDVGVPTAERIDVVVEAVELALVPKAGVEPAKKITAFTKLALTDHSVLSIIRKLREMGPMPWEDNYVHERKKPRGFQVHDRVSCKGCGMRPIVGVRFMATNKEYFNLCAKCYSRGEVSKDGIEFKLCKFSWEDKYGNVKVPPAPLKPKDRGTAVKFLHKVLSDLGYMNESMYKNRPAIYTNFTRVSVRQFQMEKGLGATCEIGIYDLPTATLLAEEVEKSMESPSADAAAVADAATNVEQN